MPDPGCCPMLQRVPHSLAPTPHHRCDKAVPPDTARRRLRGRHVLRVALPEIITFKLTHYLPGILIPLLVPAEEASITYFSIT